MCSHCKYATIPKNAITGKMSKTKAIPIVVLVEKPWYASIISSVMMKITIRSIKLSNTFSVTLEYGLTVVCMNIIKEEEISSRYSVMKMFVELITMMVSIIRRNIM